MVNLPDSGVAGGEIPTPTPTAFVITSRTQVSSPDGTKSIIMQKDIKPGSPTLYSFYVKREEQDGVLIFSKSRNAGNMSVPSNSWSPDNKHLFIIENDGVLDNYLIFKSTGEAFIDGEAYIDFRSHYSQKMKEYSLKDVTGWDAPDLLHVRTSGPPYWFELGSNAFYRLVQR